MTREALLARLEAHAQTHGISPATITSRAVGNSRLYSRLKAGGGCTLDVAQRLSDYMAAHPASPPEDAA